MPYITAISTEKVDVTRHSEDKQLYEDHNIPWDQQAMKFQNQQLQHNRQHRILITTGVNTHKIIQI